MRCRFLVAMIGFTIAPTSALAQRPVAAQAPEAASSASADTDFFATSGLVKFQFIQGRLCLDAPRHRKGSQNRQLDGSYESVTVTAERGIPSVHYVSQNSKQHLTLSVEQAYSVRIESWFPGSSERAILNQPRSGLITMQVMRGDLNDTYEAPTLLHLRHANSASFDQHYGRLIHRLLRGRSVAELSQAAEDVMLRSTPSESAPAFSDVVECVDQLRSPKRATRVAAHQRLLSWGTPVIPLLARLDFSALDPEQTLRLQALQRRLRPKVDDTPATLAKLLVNDRSYWQQIAGSLNLAQLQLANQHLQRSGARPILMTADPETRVATSAAAAAK